MEKMQRLPLALQLFVSFPQDPPVSQVFSAVASHPLMHDSENILAPVKPAIGSTDSKKRWKERIAENIFTRQR
jgi:hypothetical protein